MSSFQHTGNQDIPGGHLVDDISNNQKTKPHHGTETNNNYGETNRTKTYDSPQNEVAGTNFLVSDVCNKQKNKPNHGTPEKKNCGETNRTKPDQSPQNEVAGTKFPCHVCGKKIGACVR